jgi:translation initiation factor 1A
MPKKGEILGIAETMLGASKIMVNCKDGKLRLCRIRGKMKKRMWIRQGDVVAVKLWEIQPDRGDIVWRYVKTEANWLRRRGLL